MPFLKTVINQKLHGNDVKNVICWVGDDATIDNGQAIADGLRDIYLDVLSSFNADEWSMTSVTLYNPEAAAGTPGVEFVPTLGPIVGTNTSAAFPNQVAGLLTFLCSAGPPHRGRIYFGGCGANHLQQTGLLGGGYQDALAGFGSRLTSWFLDTGLAMGHAVIGSDTQKPIQDRTALVTGYRVNPIPASQRRRRLGVGS